MKERRLALRHVIIKVQNTKDEKKSWELTERKHKSQQKPEVSEFWAEGISNLELYAWPSYHLNMKGNWNQFLNGSRKKNVYTI